MTAALDGMLGSGLSGMLAGLFEQIDWAEMQSRGPRSGTQRRPT